MTLKEIDAVFDDKQHFVSEVTVGRCFLLPAYLHFSGI